MQNGKEAPAAEKIYTIHFIRHYFLSLRHDLYSLLLSHASLWFKLKSPSSGLLIKVLYTVNTFPSYCSNYEVIEMNLFGKLTSSNVECCAQNVECWRLSKHGKRFFALIREECNFMVLAQSTRFGNNATLLITL